MFRSEVRAQTLRYKKCRKNDEKKSRRINVSCSHFQTIQAISFLCGSFEPSESELFGFFLLKSLAFLVQKLEAKGAVTKKFWCVLRRNFNQIQCISMRETCVGNAAIATKFPAISGANGGFRGGAVSIWRGRPTQVPPP